MGIFSRIRALISGYPSKDSEEDYPVRIDVTYMPNGGESWTYGDSHEEIYAEYSYPSYDELVERYPDGFHIFYPPAGYKGPAITWKDGHAEYFINGKKTTNPDKIKQIRRDIKEACRKREAGRAKYQRRQRKRRIEMGEEAYTKEGREADKDRRPLDKVFSPVRSIRKFCVECMGGSTHEPAKCTDPQCWLYPFREGHNPRRQGKERTLAQIEASKRAGEALRRQSK